MLAPSKYPLACAAGVMFAVLSGCGGVGTPPATTPAAIDGRWGFETVVTVAVGDPSPIPFPAIIFSGVLHNNNGTVDGVGQAYFLQNNPPTITCLQPAAVTVRGTFNSARHLTLTSSQVSGTVQ